jgi:hypothetical protein
MKKKLLVAFSALAVSLISALDLHAQGTVVFQNATGYPNYPVLTNSASGPGLAVGSDYHVALYWGPLGSAETDLVQIGSALQGLPSVPGYFYASPSYTTGSATAPGDDAMFEVKGWTGNYNTYEDAVASGDPAVLVGVSGMWQNPTGGNGTPPALPRNFIFGPGGFEGLLLDTP